MSKNDITGDSLVSKKTSEAYRDNWENIWGKVKIHQSNPPDQAAPKTIGELFEQETKEKDR